VTAACPTNVRRGAWRRGGIGIFVLVLLAAGARPLAAQPAVDAAFDRFWAAEMPAEAEAAAAAVVASGVGFDEAFARLRRGRVYPPDVPRGVVALERRTPDGVFPYTLDVPASYDPRRRYPVRVQLHGGVSRPAPRRRGDGGIGTLAGDEQIYVLPLAWGDAPWWSGAQLENLRFILDRLKRTYNVDENRVALAGVSDGGTGAFYVAMRDTTPFASFLPLNAFLMVLAHPALRLVEDLYVNNLLNKPFFVVNGGLDPLYPAPAVAPFLQHLQQGGVRLDYHPQPGAAHNTAWWPDVKGLFEAFVREHPREPLPAKLTWETDRRGPADYTARAHWLVIERLAAPGIGGRLPDLNDYGRSGSRPLFPRRRPSGRVDLVREGNTVRVTSTGVAELTLLLSPDAFDLARPVTVVVDGRTLFDARVERSVATLMKWAARDNDRTLLVGAELRVALPPDPRAP
jgi:hypothetical protein